MSSDGFYFKLATLRFATFFIVGTCALLFTGWRRAWTEWDVIWFETGIITFTAMILSLPSAWIRTRMMMDRRKRQAKRDASKD